VSSISEHTFVSPVSSDGLRTSSNTPVSYCGAVTLARSERVLAELYERRASAPYEELTLTVSSCGGPTGAAMYLYDTIRTIKMQLTTIGTGDVDSSGIVVFLAGTRRLISPRTTLLLHEAGRHFDPHQRFTARELDAMAREDRLKDEQYASVVAANASNLSVSDVLDMMRDNTVLSPDDCVKFGLAHALVS